MFNQSALVNEITKLEHFALRLTRNHPDRDDLVQSTCLRALEKSDRFEDGTNLFGWTSKIMFNIFITDYRRRARFESNYDSEIIISNQSVDPQQEIDLDIRRLYEFLKQLSKDHREIIQLICLDGWSYQDIAVKLGIPIGTVRSRLARARHQLEILMNEPLSKVLFIPDQEKFSNNDHESDDFDLPYIPGHIKNHIMNKHASL
jgi:RNA polymerase sigma-70 factor (ECF subfamily)